ncbi:hypothetical protein [Clostridium sp. Ade.TY]|uniref:hypothetical protein n=1 Tax=Clostridium sp. Ade.TY TaxID=1391647 RepID=UPI0012694606|nr:hypothetical protein [Clostridium sp. Ade.TY]
MIVIVLSQKVYVNLNIEDVVSIIPKFNLFDLQRMNKSKEGQLVIKKILENKNIKIFNYYIQAVGYFDKVNFEKFREHTKSNLFKGTDLSIHFKACPFVEDGKGCSIPPQFRTPVCNFFLCKEIKNELKEKNLLKEYEDSAKEYYRYYEFENKNLIELLEERGLTLKHNIEECLNFLKSIDCYTCEFPNLKSFISK